MKTTILTVLAISTCLILHAQNLKPYILGSTSDKSIELLKSELIQALESNGFEIAGSYSPASDNNRMVVVVTHPLLIESVQKTGGLTGFSAALRIAITLEGSVTNISYTDPMYMGHAYFRDDFPKVEENFNMISNNLVKTMQSVGSYKGEPFGSEDGIEPDDLHDYRYMFGMPYFDDTNVVGDFGSFEEATETIDANLANGVPNASLVYKIEIPGKDLALYGIGLSGEEGESLFLPKIDISSPKHTAFLPYEILVMDKEVHMLHGRYRIALSFPDLTMGTFTKIMSTPGNIEDMMEAVTGN